jgi:hypothetical protein
LSLYIIAALFAMRKTWTNMLISPSATIKIQPDNQIQSIVMFIIDLVAFLIVYCCSAASSYLYSYLGRALKNHC